MTKKSKIDQYTDKEAQGHEEAIKKMDQFNAQSLSITAWAFAVINFANYELFEKMSHFLLNYDILNHLDHKYLSCI